MNVKGLMVHLEELKSILEADAAIDTKKAFQDLLDYVPKKIMVDPIYDLGDSLEVEDFPVRVRLSPNGYIEVDEREFKDMDISIDPEYFTDDMAEDFVRDKLGIPERDKNFKTIVKEYDSFLKKNISQVIKRIKNIKADFTYYYEDSDLDVDFKFQVLFPSLKMKGRRVVPQQIKILKAHY